MGIQGLHKFLENNTNSDIKELHYSKLQDKIVAIDTSINIIK